MDNLEQSSHTGDAAPVIRPNTARWEAAADFAAGVLGLLRAFDDEMGASAGWPALALEICQAEEDADRRFSRALINHLALGDLS